MAIIYSYPNLPLSSLSADDLLVITDIDNTNNNPTKSVKLSDIATYVTGTGGGTGTTNKIVKFTDGANGLLGDSIMTESTGLIDLAGQFVSTSSPTLTQLAPVSGIKAILNGTTSAPNVALYGESKNTGSTQANSNYGLFAKGEFEGTGGFTGFVIGGNLEGRYDGTGTNGASATVYGSYNLARATTAANGTISYMVGASNLAKLEGANVTATNLQGTHSTVELSNGTAGDVIVQILDFDGTGGTVTGDLSYLQIQNDTMPTVAGTKRAINSKSVLPSLFTGQVEIPLVPTINAHATSKQYVDQQISSVVSGLVFINTWDASSTPGGSPDLTDASTQVVGHYYVVSVAGSATPNGAGTVPNSWNVGDWCIYVEQGATDRWEKLDQTFVSGAGAAGQVTYWNSQNEVAGDNSFLWDNTNKRLGIGVVSPTARLQVYESGTTAEKTWGVTNAGAILVAYQSTNGSPYTKTTDLVAGSDGTVPSEIRLITRTAGASSLSERLRIDSAGDISISPRGTAASSGSGILYFKNVDDNSATINGASIRTVDSNSNPSGADMRFQVASDAGTLSDAVTINSSGFVGIATTAPDYPLDVSSFGTIRISNGTSNSVQLIIDNSNTTDAGTETSEIRFRHYRSYVAGQNDAGSIIVGKEEPWDAAGDRNSYMSFSTRTGTLGATEKMRITSTGNVGIGTTSPQAALHVAGAFDTTAPTGDGILMGSFNTTHGVIQLNGTSGSFIDFSTSGVDHKGRILYDNNSNYFRIDTNGTEKVRILSSGNVGIGTTSPNTKLYISSDSSTTATIEAKNPTAFNDPQLNFVTWNEASGSSSGKIQLTNGTFNSNDMAFFTETANSVTEKMRIKSSGNVGIGTTNPTATLHVSGSKADATDKPTMISESVFTVKPVALNSGNLNFAQVDSGNAIGMQYTNGTGTANWNISMQPFGGNVGIGTTSPNALGFLEKVLNVSAGSSSSTTLQQAGITISGSSDSNDANDFAYLSFTNHQSTLSADRVAEIRVKKVGTDVDKGEFTFYTANGTSLTEALTIGSSQDTTFAGNVSLASGKELTINNNASNNNNGIHIKNDTDAYSGALTFHTEYSGTDTNVARIQGGTNGTNGILYLQTANTSKTLTTALSLDFNQNAAFEGDVTISNATPTLNLTDTDNSSNISLSSVGGALIVNSTSDQVYQIGGTEYFRIAASGGTFAGNVNAGTGLRMYTDGSGNGVVYNLGQDKDLYFVGDDGGTGINALVLDMSEGGNATFAGKVNVAGSTNNESALNVLTQNGSIGSIGFETGSEVTGIISSNTELMEFRVGDGVGISSAKQLKIDTGGIEVTGDAEITNSSNGLILKSPDGTRYRVTVANGGTLSVSAV